MKNGSKKWQIEEIIEELFFRNFNHFFSIRVYLVYSYRQLYFRLFSNLIDKRKQNSMLKIIKKDKFISRNYDTFFMNKRYIFKTNVK